MTIKKTVTDEGTTKVAPGLDFSKVREWADVTPEVQKLKEAGLTVPEIADQLQVNYVLVNQCVLQSYKMLIDSVQVFKRQEEKRVNS